MKFKILSSIGALSFLLLGCSAFLETDKNHDSIKSEMKEFYPEEAAAVYVSAPVQNISIPVNRDPAWTKLNASEINGTGGLPLYFVMSSILSDKGVNYSFDEGVDPNQVVTVHVKGTVKNALDQISASTGYSYELESFGVKWSHYITETFSLSYIPGKYEYLVGSTAETGSQQNTGSGEQINFGKQSKEFSSVTSTGNDAFDEVEKVLTQIVSEYGSVSVSRTTNSAIVTTTKSKMQKIKRYMSLVEKSLGRQIALEIKMFRFTARKSGQVGIDWNFIKNKSNGRLVFDGGDLSNMAPGTSPITFSPSRTTGSTAGSDLLMQLLDEQGYVSVVNKPRIVTQPNRVFELELKELTGYLAKTEVTQVSDSISSGPTASLIGGVVESGYMLYAIANIGSDDKIIFNMSSTYTDLVDITRKEVFESAIETPQLTRNRMSSTTVLRSGTTMIIGGLQLQSSNDANGSPLSAKYLPTRARAQSQTTETIALVTPVIIDMN